VKRVTTVVPAAVALLLGCQDPGGPAAPQLSTDPVAAVVSAGLKAPSNISAVALSETQVDISWQDNSPNETGFQVHRSPTGALGTFTLLATTAAGVTAYRDQGLEPSRHYCYQARAVRASGNNALYSAFSNTACATTLAPPPPPPPPPPAAASGTIAAPLTSNRVSLSWTDNSSNEDGFRIYGSIDGGAVWDLAGTVGANNKYGETYAVAEQPVCYRVVAFNAGGEAAPSNTACTTPPAEPTNLTATRVDTETVELTWNDNSAVEDGYRVWLVQMKCIFACPQFDPECEYYGFCDQTILIADLAANSTVYTGRIIRNEAYPYEFVYVVATKDGASSDASAQVPLP